ncbi:MAG TPA: hypothetical protein VFR67_03100 [Pilimelia sp.]|nr:hypothetical protein [Pilimelia sp.]
MTRRYAVVGGSILAAAGFVLGLISLAVPWATYRVSADVPGAEADLQRTGGIAVFQLDRGQWYVLVLFVLLGVLGAAAVARGRAARVAGVAAVLLGVAGMLVATMLANQVSSATVSSGVLGTVDLRASPASGVKYGLVALPLLALGAALLSVRTPAR